MSTDDNETKRPTNEDTDVTAENIDKMIYDAADKSGARLPQIIGMYAFAAQIMDIDNPAGAARYINLIVAHLTQANIRFIDKFNYSMVANIGLCVTSDHKVYIAWTVPNMYAGERVLNWVADELTENWPPNLGLPMSYFDIVHKIKYSPGQLTTWNKSLVDVITGIVRGEYTTINDVEGGLLVITESIKRSIDRMIADEPDYLPPGYDAAGDTLASRTFEAQNARMLSPNKK